MAATPPPASPPGHRNGSRQATLLNRLDAARRLAALVPPLPHAAPAGASAASAGLHGNRRSGQGDAFWQYRRLVAGDSLSMVDWRQSGRSNHLYIRQREREDARTIALWCAGDEGMRWRSSPELCEKEERGQVLLLALGLALTARGERLLDLAALEAPREFGPGGKPAGGPGIRTLGGQHAVSRLASQWQHHPHSRELPPAFPLPPHSQAVLVGDWWSDPADTARRLASLSQRGGRCLLVQVVDPQEESFPFEGRTLFFHPGSGRQGEGACAPWLARRAEDLAPAWPQRLAAHRDALQQAVRRHGGTLILHHTDQPPRHALMAIMTALAGGDTLAGAAAPPRGETTSPGEKIAIIRGGEKGAGHAP